MMYEQGLIEASLLAFEEQVLHPAGWDQGCRLMLLIAGEMTDEFAALEAITLPLPDFDVPVNYAKVLRYVGARMRRTPAPPDLPAATKGVVGVAFASEGWAQPEGYTEEQNVERLRAGRSLGDTLGAREIRMLHAVDVAGRYYMVQRIRGEEATVEVIADSRNSESLQIAGRVAQGLRDITYAICAQVPEVGGDLAAIDAIARRKEPSLRIDAIARRKEPSLN